MASTQAAYVAVALLCLPTFILLRRCVRVIPATLPAEAGTSVCKNAAMASYSVNDRGVAHARELIETRQYVLTSDWGDVQPDADTQNTYLAKHTWQEYADWHLGLTDGANDETKARYAFVYGDLTRVHRAGLIACVYRASEWRHKDVELAAHDLLQLLDEHQRRDRPDTGPRRRRRPRLRPRRRRPAHGPGRAGRAGAGGGARHLAGTLRSEDVVRRAGSRRRGRRFPGGCLCRRGACAGGAALGRGRLARRHRRAARARLRVGRRAPGQP